jgi:hypothetical protein
LELSGASGGIFPGKAMTQSRDSWADRMVTNVRLIAGQQIGVMLGHRGECICDTPQNDQKHQQQLRREQAELVRGNGTFGQFNKNSNFTACPIVHCGKSECAGGNDGFVAGLWGRWCQPLLHWQQSNCHCGRRRWGLSIAHNFVMPKGIFSHESLLINLGLIPMNNRQAPIRAKAFPLVSILVAIANHGENSAQSHAWMDT